MDSHSPIQTANTFATGKTINRRSLLKGSASVAATAVAFTTMGALGTKAEAAPPAATASRAIHPMEDFPGGV